MKRSFRITAVAFILLLVISLSLNIVFAVGQGAEPGSDQDPIISKSYVDAAVAELVVKIQSLVEQNDGLKNQNNQLITRVVAQEEAAKALQVELKAVQAELKVQQEELKAVKASVVSGTGNAGNTGTTGGTTTKPPATIGKATVNTAILNVRSQPNTTSAIVVKVAKGDTLTLVSKSGDWYKVTTATGKSGFVLGSLIVVKK